MSDDKAVNRTQRSWRRLSERLLARNRHRLDEAGGVLARQLDFWNRKLAERAIPRARRERVEAMARKRGPSGARLSVVPAKSRTDDEGLS
ncbi:hypothetical protein DES49_0971 [Halospina denitrificans]|uniref:Uncharacterized protein n=1 Tax=Halospina denitrificans TaxID=332522 RepID=A0A4R7K135_9GAMM|nr:hypothetical protein [Halospina denitrificans]TDT43159.1 hypothetical protein DES49_0971 [Halospina denitrificans]